MKCDYCGVVDAFWTAEAIAEFRSHFGREPSKELDGVLCHPCYTRAIEDGAPCVVCGKKLDVRKFSPAEIRACERMYEHYGQVRVICTPCARTQATVGRPASAHGEH